MSGPLTPKGCNDHIYMPLTDIRIWLAAQDWRKPMRQIALESGLPYSVVYSRAKRYGISSSNSYNRKIPAAEKLNWNLRDTDLAARYGVSIQRIGQLRRKHGAPQSPLYRRKKP